jgi:hypothetical protein
MVIKQNANDNDYYSSVNIRASHLGLAQQDASRILPELIAPLVYSRASNYFSDGDASSGSPSTPRKRTPEGAGANLAGVEELVWEENI